jgi:hypothetical protein
MVALIAIVVYLALGVVRVVLDYTQPGLNKPDYAANLNLPVTLLVIVSWPFLFAQDTLFFYRYYKVHCTRQGLSRVVEFILIVGLHRRLYKDRWST